MSIKEWFTVWFKAARAPFLVVSLLPSLLGGMIAWYHNSAAFNWVIFAAATVGIVMAHSAADFIDDYFDFLKGNLGNKEKQFHDSPLIDGKVTLRQVVIATALCLAIALASGIYLLVKVGTPVIWMTLAGTFIVFFYTSPPVKLNYRGLGETALFIAFGPLITFGVFYVITGQLSLEAFMAGIVPGIFTMNVGLVSNTFDYEDDVVSGKKCIPVRFGQKNAVRILGTVSVLAYLIQIGGVVAGLMPAWTLIILVTMPLAWKIIQASSQYADRSNYTRAMTKAIALASLSSILLTVGYLLEVLI